VSGSPKVGTLTPAPSLRDLVKGAKPVTSVRCHGSRSPVELAVAEAGVGQRFKLDSLLPPGLVARLTEVVGNWVLPADQRRTQTQWATFVGVLGRHVDTLGIVELDSGRSGVKALHQEFFADDIAYSTLVRDLRGWRWAGFVHPTPAPIVSGKEVRPLCRLYIPQLTETLIWCAAHMREVRRAQDRRKRDRLLLGLPIDSEARYRWGEKFDMFDVNDHLTAKQIYALATAALCVRAFPAVELEPTSDWGVSHKSPRLRAATLLRQVRDCHAFKTPHPLADRMNYEYMKCT
jgi:hypothetical protein